AGGVALNCVANGKILRDGCFESIWIQPAAGDAGGALGAALAVTHLHAGVPRPAVRDGRDRMKGALLGPSFSQAEIERRLTLAGAKFRRIAADDVAAQSARLLADGKALGWFEGRAEFGPRALGARSILADPRSPDTQSVLNQKIKFRESFRPFAPAVLREHVSEWFELERDSPYMLLVAPVAPEKRRRPPSGEPLPQGLECLALPRSVIPAVTHVDDSARVQTVDSVTNPRFHQLLQAFLKITGCPVLVNTSFNVRGEPIVGTPEDAFRCFMGTRLDALIVGDCLLLKEEQKESLHLDYHRELKPD
ncbi:MAG: carbamoyltransferase C-terminal domain-containing protein, partial [Bdellovibrionota bacterium]